MIFSCGEFDAKEEVTLYIRSNGVHTDICMPTSTNQKDWLESINLLAYEDQNHLEYIAIGWGDKGFFLDTPTWAELKASTAVKAVFLPSPTAMHVEFLAEPQVSGTIREVKVSKRSYRKLIRFVESSFLMKDNHPILIPGHGYGLTDNFYEAHGNYHMFNTCNVWTNDAMKSASIPTSIFSIFPEGNLMHLSK
ncbi:MAG: TIGR02117 family protein [Crocinitomicaceae bacterium]|nr:TIGR02117 family protein [Crocinitomicaceae bacterium]